jgi:hypothetical protein
MYDGEYFVEKGDGGIMGNCDELDRLYKRETSSSINLIYSSREPNVAM